MPIYEYHCSECGSTFEELVLAKQSEAVKCSGCGSSEVERKFSTFAAQTSNGSTASKAPSFEGGSCGCGAGPAGMCGMN
jgi:putative FmdB family regulatory protein